MFLSLGSSHVTLQLTVECKHLGISWICVCTCDARHNDWPYLGVSELVFSVTTGLCTFCTTDALKVCTFFARNLCCPFHDQTQLFFPEGIPSLTPQYWIIAWSKALGTCREVDSSPLPKATSLCRAALDLGLQSPRRRGSRKRQCSWESAAGCGKWNEEHRGAEPACRGARQRVWGPAEEQD